MANTGANNRAVFRLRGGKIETFDTSTAPYPENGRARFAPGFVSPLAVRADVLERIAAVADRTAPWATFWLGPVLWTLNDPEDAHLADVCEQRQDRLGRSWKRSLGAAYSGVETAYLTLCSPMRTAAVLHHEAFHLAEYFLSDDERAAMDAAVAAGAAWGDQYTDSLVERRARLYEHFASVMDEGMPPFASDSDAIKLMWSVYAGDFGREVMAAKANQAKPEQAKPDKVRLLDRLFRRAR